MLSTRRRDDVDEEERVPLTTYTETSLFEGLSFPEVPTTTIRRDSPITENPSISYLPDPVAESYNNDMEMIELTDMPSAPTLQEESHHPLLSTSTNVISQQSITTSISSKDSSVPLVKGSLSTLYASAEIISSEPEVSPSNFYPEVPSLSVGHSTPVSFTASTRSIPIQDRMPRPSVSTISPMVSSGVNSTFVDQQRNFAMSQQIPITQETTKQSSANLVDELLQENSRLTKEVQHLRTLVAQQQTQQQTRSPSLAQTPATGMQVANTNNPPAADVKYVCCGACRQWLLAPKEATYVVCSRCQAVNNCNLTPSNRAGEHNGQQFYTRQSDLPWFLDCLTRPFSGSL